MRITATTPPASQQAARSAPPAAVREETPFEPLAFKQTAGQPAGTPVAAAAPAGRARPGSLVDIKI